MKFQGAHRRQSIHEKNNKVIRLTFPDFKTYHKATLIKAIWYWPKDEHTDLWNRSLSPEINPHACGQLNTENVSKTIQWGQNKLFNKWC